jgi:hypothetical protein
MGKKKLPLLISELYDNLPADLKNAISYTDGDYWFGNRNSGRSHLLIVQLASKALKDFKIK